MTDSLPFISVRMGGRGVRLRFNQLLVLNECDVEEGVVSGLMNVMSKRGSVKSCLICESLPDLCLHWFGLPFIQ